jgi:hypothetical protein
VQSKDLVWEVGDSLGCQRCQLSTSNSAAAGPAAIAPSEETAQQHTHHCRRLGQHRNLLHFCRLCLWGPW